MHVRRPPRLLFTDDALIVVHMYLGATVVVFRHGGIIHCFKDEEVGNATPCAVEMNRFEFTLTYERWAMRRCYEWTKRRC